MKNTITDTYNVILRRISTAVRAFGTDMEWLQPCFDDLLTSPDLTNEQRNYLDGYLVGRVAVVTQDFDAKETVQDFENRFEMMELLYIITQVGSGIYPEADSPTIDGILEGLEDNDTLRLSEKAFVQGFGQAVSLGR